MFGERVLLESSKLDHPFCIFILLNLVSTPFHETLTDPYGEFSVKSCVIHGCETFVTVLSPIDSRGM